MNILLIGGSNLGYYLAKLLLDEKHEVILIEKDEEKAQRISDELDIVTIIDDATKQEVLENSGIRTADAVIAITDEDDANLVVGMLAKSLGAKKVAVKLTRTNYNQVFLTKMGIDFVFNPDVAAANYIEELLTKPDIVDLAFLSKGEAEIIEKKVDNTMQNKKVSDFITDKSSIIALFDEKGKINIPKPNYKLKKGEKILILTETNR